MSTYIKRRLGNPRGLARPTTQHEVRAMLDDPAQRDALLARTDRTVGLLRTLIGRDPREMAYTLATLDNEIDAWSGFFDLACLAQWVGTATAILDTHPQVRDFLGHDDRVVVKGRLLKAVVPGKGGAK